MCDPVSYKGLKAAKNLTSDTDFRRCSIYTFVDSQLIPKTINLGLILGKLPRYIQFSLFTANT
jgi:hypothetical protein